MNERGAWIENAKALSSRGLNGADVRAAARVFDVGERTATRLLLASSVPGEAIARRRVVRGGTRIEAAQVVIASYDTRAAAPSTRVI
jgi:hypothetical protein